MSIGASQQNRPVIGICAPVEHARWSVWAQPAALLASSYIDIVQAAGGFAVMLPPDGRLSDRPAEALALIDGLMLVGGADVDPAAYGCERDPLTVETAPQRDAFEIALVTHAIERDVPVLGICRGMQLINVALGGTLIQDLPQRFGNHRHLKAVGTFDGSQHVVQIVPRSLAARAAGETKHVTKSHHHQGVERIGDGLCATAISPLDGLVEALELPGKRFVLGVQWHPEADEASNVIRAFVAAAAERRSAADGHVSAADLAISEDEPSAAKGQVSAEMGPVSTQQVSAETASVSTQQVSAETAPVSTQEGQAPFAPHR